MAVKKSNRERTSAETKPKARRKAKHNVNSQEFVFVSVAVTAVVGAVALPAIASAVTLSTAVIGGIAGAAVGISYMAGKNNKNRARNKGGEK
ncbi:MAG: hypothetical protein V3S46_09295 [Nitrospinota bacterium]